MSSQERSDSRTIPRGHGMQGRGRAAYGDAGRMVINEHNAGYGGPPAMSGESRQGMSPHKFSFGNFGPTEEALAHSPNGQAGGGRGNESGGRRPHDTGRGGGRGGHNQGRHGDAGGRGNARNHGYAPQTQMMQFGSVPFRPEDHPNFQPTSAGSFHSQPMQPYPIYPGPPGNFPPMMEPYGFNHMVQPGQMPHNLYQNFPGYSHPTQFNQNRAQQTPPRPYAPRVDNKPKPNLAKPQPNPKSPEAQKKRILTLTNPNTKEVVDLRKSPGSSQEVPVVRKQPAQGGPSGQPPAEPVKRVLSIKPPPSGGPSKPLNRTSPVQPVTPATADPGAADQAAEDGAAAEQALADKTTVDKDAAENAAAEKAAAEKASADKASAEKAAADKAAAEKAAEEKAAAEKAATEKAAAEKKAAADKAAAEKVAAEEKAAAEKAAAEEAAAEKAEANKKAAAEKAEADKKAADKAAAEKAAADEERVRKEEAAKLAKEQKLQEEAEAKAKAEAAPEVEALEDAASAQTEAAAVAAEVDDSQSSESPKKFVPPKKKGKKHLLESIAKREAADANDKGGMLSAYTAPSAPLAEPQPPAISTPPASTAEPEVPSPKASPGSEEADWETRDASPVHAKVQQEKDSKFYSSDFLLKCRDNLKETGELENWPGAQAIELQDVLVGVPNGRRLQTARSGPRVPPAMGRPPGADKWAQKGPLPGPAMGQAPGLGGPPHGRMHGAMGPMGANQPVNGGGDSWRRRDPFPPAPPPQRFPELHKAANKFERGKLISENPEEEARQKAIKSLLNKVTPEKYAVILEKLMQVEIPSVLSLSGLIDQIYEKGVTEPTFTELYARLCYDLNQRLGSYKPEPSSGDEKDITFRRLLLNKCQEEFTEGARAISAVKEREKTDAANKEKELEDGEIKPQEEEEDKLEAKKKEIAEAIAEQKARHRALGNMQFVGFLYKHRLIAEKIMHECIKTLLEDVNTPRREDIECLCKLISTIGRQLDAGKQKAYMDVYFSQPLQMLIKLPGLESRLRFMIQDVLDLRRNGWQERRKVEGPKTIEEIHRDARMEQMAAQRPDFGSRRSGPLGGRNSFRENPPPARPPQTLRRHEDRLEAPPRPMQRIPSQEAFAPGGRAGGFRPGGMLSSRAASPATRDPAPTQAAPAARPTEPVEPPQPAGDNPEDEKIKGWADLLVKYSVERDLDWAKSAITRILIPRGVDSKIFNDIFLAAVEKREVRQDTTLEILGHLVTADLVPSEVLLEGLTGMLEAVPDAVADAPFAPALVGSFSGSLVINKKTSLQDVGTIILEAAEKPPKDEDNMSLLESGDAVKVLAAALAKLAEDSNKDTAKAAWQETGLDLSSFLAEFDRGADNEKRVLATLRQRNSMEGIL